MGSQEPPLSSVKHFTESSPMEVKGNAGTFGTESKAERVFRASKLVWLQVLHERVPFVPVIIPEQVKRFVS